MKVIKNRLIPFKGFFAMNLFGICFVRSDVKYSQKQYDVMINHESIHTEQMKEMGYIFFYIWYVVEWLIKLVFNGGSAYYDISFEREAYENENNSDYIKSRKRYSWFNRIINK